MEIFFHKREAWMIELAILAGVSKATGSPWPLICIIATCSYYTIFWTLCNFYVVFILFLRWNALLPSFYYNRGNNCPRRRRSSEFEHAGRRPWKLSFAQWRAFSCLLSLDQFFHIPIRLFELLPVGQALFFGFDKQKRPFKTIVFCVDDLDNLFVDSFNHLVRPILFIPALTTLLMVHFWRDFPPLCSLANPFRTCRLSPEQMSTAKL